MADAPSHCVDGLHNLLDLPIHPRCCVHSGLDPRLHSVARALQLTESAGAIPQRLLEGSEVRLLGLSVLQPRPDVGELLLEESDVILQGGNLQLHSRKLSKW